MPRAVRVRLLIAVPMLVLAVLVALAPAAATPSQKVLRSTAPIEAIAMDGSRLAYVAEGAHGCVRISVWNVATNRQVPAAARRECNAYQKVRALAVGRDRTAWIFESCGNSECDDVLYTSSSAAKPNRRLAQASRVGESCSAGDCPEGTPIEGLVASGDLLAVSRWSADASRAVLPGAGLDVLTGGGLKRVVVGTQGIVSWAADSGRIAVLRPLGTISGHPGVTPYEGSTVGVYSRGGRLLRTVARMIGEGDRAPW